jgi:hypothetical protein
VPVEHPPPTDATAKQLYATAIACAFPDCGEPLYRTEFNPPALNSRIAHICARREGGPRWDAGMSPAENRSSGNLVLLCIVHAALVDQNELVAQYPVGMLREWKSEQIAAYKRAVDAGRDAGWQLTDDQAAEVVQESERRVVRVMVHRAFFMHGHHDPRQQFCIWVTNLSPQRTVEITHIWFETNPRRDILNPARPLPKRLRPDQRWETWIAVADVPTEDDLEWKVRVLLSNGEVVKSVLNPNPPPVGFVAGP